MAEVAKNLFAEILRMIVDPLRTKFQGNWNFRLRRPLRKQRAAKMLVCGAARASSPSPGSGQAPSGRLRTKGGGAFEQALGGGIRVSRSADTP
jgi:hypothetical protein